jgi:hypothetical protein
LTKDDPHIATVVIDEDPGFQNLSWEDCKNGDGKLESDSADLITALYKHLCGLIPSKSQLNPPDHFVLGFKQTSH